ncbi:hypothetical protein SAMN00120144_1760 [Hymenobacter roseosalivarius DSM 11622]|uniref:Uncharacterized protein n=1 Tax=Hymenobacter roseosalivarius DSM 11622 TaxID=645990 RepID=A0A1W1W040_9BACT|nr:hypothetical protein SAMN00120144_1760 [Hymenobacter roseosalivarius DSM 11622]
MGLGNGTNILSFSTFSKRQHFFNTDFQILILIWSISQVLRVGM